MIKRSKDNGHISITVYADGGVEALPKSLIAANEIAFPVMIADGLGKMNRTDLIEYLQKHRIELQPEINDSHHGFWINVRNPNFEKAFHLLHLSFFRAKPHVGQFEIMQEQWLKNIINFEKTEYGQHQKKLIDQTYLAGSEHISTNSQLVKQLEVVDISSTYRYLFGDLSKFKFVIVGDFDEDKIRGYLEKYIANIPTKTIEFTEQFVKISDKEVVVKSYNNPEDKAYISVYYANETTPNDEDTKIALELFAEIVEDRIFDELREKKSLIYAVETVAYNLFSRIQPAVFKINLSSAPKNETVILDAIHQIINDIKQNGIGKKDFDIAKNLYFTKASKKYENNDTYAYYYAYYLAKGFSIVEIEKFEDKIQDFSHENVNKIINKFLDDAMLRTSVFSKK